MNTIRRDKNGRRSFKGKTTNSPGKSQNEAFYDAVFYVHLYAYLKANKNATAHILVGDVSGLDRHIGRLLALGFLIQNIYIHELVDELADSLKLACLKRGYKCKVETGCMISKLDKFGMAGMNIAYVEFDGTSSYGRFEFKLFQLCKIYNIPFILTEGASRYQDVNFKSWCQSNGIKKTIDERHAYENRAPRYELERIAPIVAQKEMKGYVSHYETYQGVSGMYTQAFINKRYI
jgi:hypothetical protein